MTQGAAPAQPSVYGPGATHPGVRMMLRLVGLGAGGGCVWAAVTDFGLRMDLSGVTLARGDGLLILLAAGIVLLFWSFSLMPWTQAVLTIDDHGVTTELRGAATRPPATVPFHLLDRVEVTPLGTSHTLTIAARDGAPRRWFEVRDCTLQVGTNAPLIAREIARRARAAGVIVQGPEGRGPLMSHAIWRFAPSSAPPLPATDGP
jgi:hypothetical protein